jgi:transposase
MTRRPTKLTPEVQERIAVLIRAGNTVEVAAGATGIGRGTFYEWMARGEKDGAANRPHRNFRAAIEQARNESEAAMVARIAKAASNGSWQAAGWLLERRYPERWTKREQMPKGEEGDRLDELTARRVARVAGGAGT